MSQPSSLEVTDDDRVARALKALLAGVEQLARRLAVEERKLIPAYTVIDETAHAKRIAGVLRELPKDIANAGSFPRTLATLRANMQLVMTSGVESRDFLHLSYLYLSVMRKLVVTSSPDLREGLRDWDALEARLMGAPLRAFVELALTVEEPTMPHISASRFPPDVSSAHPKTDEE